jgi:hypothetical protein
VYEAPLTVALAIAPVSPGHSPKISRGVWPMNFCRESSNRFFGSWVHVDHAFVGAQHQHGCGQQLEARKIRDVGRRRRRKEAQLHGGDPRACTSHAASV